MKSKLPLAGVVLWGLVALLLLGALVLTLTGVIKLPFFEVEWGGVDDARLIREESFALDDLVSLKISGRAEDISVALVPGDEIVVRQYGNPDRDPAFTDSRTTVGGGSALTLAVPNKSIFRLFGWRGGKRLEIGLPSRYAGDLDLTSVSGNVNFPEGFEGRALTLSSTSGQVVLGPSTIASLSLDAISGDILLKAVTVRGDVKLHTTSGEVRAADIRADNAKLSSVSGSIMAGTLALEGRADLNTTSGDIRIGGLHCRDYDIGSISGGVSIKTALSGAGRLHTTSGDVSAAGVAPTGALSVSAVSGSVSLTLAPGCNCDLQLSSVSGGFHGNMPLLYAGKRKATGTVGEGGPPVSVSTTSGDITVNAAD